MPNRVYEQILKDAAFLKDHNIIEYSLLIGIHTCTPSDIQKPSK